MSNYRELDVWQKSRCLTAEVYRVTSKFPRAEMFGLTQQMRRAAVSVPCNIAEAHGRRTDADISHFLLIARGSLLELETEALLSADLGFATEEETNAIIAGITSTVRPLNGLIRYYRTRAKPT
jgi:four helix bundle protein